MVQVGLLPVCMLFGMLLRRSGRMETDTPSVLNAFSQAHDAQNVFVADAGPFVSNAHKNATWTILALAWRTAEYIADERRKGNL